MTLDEVSSGTPALEQDFALADLLQHNHDVRFGRIEIWWHEEEPPVSKPGLHRDDEVEQFKVFVPAIALQKIAGDLMYRKAKRRSEGELAPQTQIVNVEVRLLADPSIGNIMLPFGLASL